MTEQAEMYDGQLELEYTCVSCSKNSYPRRLHSGYCSDCLIGGMTDEEIAEEHNEWAETQERLKLERLRDAAYDVCAGKRTLESAAAWCYASIEEMQVEVDDVRHEQDANDWDEYQTEKATGWMRE